MQFDFPDKNGSPYKSSGGKMVYNEKLKREIPENWAVKKISGIAKIVGGSTPSKENPEYFSKESGFAWITPKDLSENKGNKYIDYGSLYVTDKGLKSASLTVMPEGTVLMSSRAPIGYISIAMNETTTNQGFKSFVPKDAISSEFLFYKVENLLPKIISLGSGSTFKEVSASNINDIDIDVPTMDTISLYTNISRPFFQKQKNLQQESQQLSAFRDWLLPMLINGQVKFA